MELYHIRYIFFYRKISIFLLSVEGRAVGHVLITGPSYVQLREVFNKQKIQTWGGETLNQHSIVTVLKLNMVQKGKKNSVKIIG